MKTAHRYSVTVGNIGQVYDGTNARDARATFREYADQSARGYGRAAAEPVTLWMDGEPIRESDPFSPARVRAALAALDHAETWQLPDALAAVPFDALGDDYRRDPEAACRKALRLTRGIQRPSRRLRAIDRLLGNHGIESVRHKNGSHAFSYSNTGDAYAPTVILFASGAFRVSSWGDIVERNMNRFA